MEFHPLCTHLETYELDCFADASSIIHLNQSSIRDHQVLVQHHHRAQTTNAEKVRLVIMYRFSLLETSSPIRSRYEQCIMFSRAGQLVAISPSLNQPKNWWHAGFRLFDLFPNNFWMWIFERQNMIDQPRPWFWLFWFSSTFHLVAR